MADRQSASMPVGSRRKAATPALRERRPRAGRMASGGVIREAAAALFLERGYQSTSMDDIAAAARVSKQTIYTHFADKQELFADLVLGNVERVDAFLSTMADTLRGTDAETGLHRFARLVRARAELARGLGQAGRRALHLPDQVTQAGGHLGEGSTGLLQPVLGHSKLQAEKRSQLDRLYQRVSDDLDQLLHAVGLRIAA